MSEIKDTSKDYDDFIGKVNEDDKPITLFEDEPIVPETEKEAAKQLQWQEHWKGMPSYQSDDLEAKRKLIVNFATEEAFDDFCKKLNLRLTDKTKTTFYPSQENQVNALMWVDDNDA